MSEIKIGDSLWKYSTFTGSWEYIVTAEIKREQAMLYEIEARNCSHGYNCRLLVSKVNEMKDGRYRFVSMLNDDDDQHYYWHNDDCFFMSRKKAKLEKYEKVIADRKKDVEKAKVRLKILTDQLDEIEQHYENIRSDSDGIPEAETQA